jgi:hypothetical protein
MSNAVNFTMRRVFAVLGEYHHFCASLLSIFVIERSQTEPTFLVHANDRNTSSFGTSMYEHRGQKQGVDVDKS